MGAKSEMERPCLYEVTMYDPETDTRAFLVIDTLQHRMCGGGIRMMPDVDLTLVRRLAKAMTYKFGAAKVPAGGAKSGIVGDPGASEKKKHLAAFARMAEPFLKSMYVAGEDMGTTAEDIAYVYKTIGLPWAALARKKAQELGREIHIPEDFDPAATGGQNLEEILTGYGIAEVTAQGCAHIGLDPQGARVAVQGFGTVGSMAARFLAEKGMSIEAVADVEGTIYRPSGLPLEDLLAAKDGTGRIERRKLPEDCCVLAPEAWLGLDVDILVPAAVADAINEADVPRIRAKLVVQGANLPVTESAEVSLSRRGIVTVPDFIANAGAAGGLGMILTGQVPLDPMRILEELGQRLRATTREVLRLSEVEGILPRQAAIRLAEAGRQEARHPVQTA